ncbi:MAG TPA: gamma carbonic anhydrase family protein, partial [Xanthobacteraceae bacterium]|nr:gamma carbonic anhydrase family protein [Xanthobacteraceae bacterium]
NSIVGAGALCTEGKAFPDNSLIVGAPARAVRAVDQKALDLITWSADWYVKNWKRHAHDSKRIG